MTHPLQAHFDRVSALLLELRTALQDDSSFLEKRTCFNEYLSENGLELALHAACDALLEKPRPACSEEVLKLISDAHSVMELHDDCVERLQANCTS
jgi:hypothetical protein